MRLKLFLVAIAVQSAIPYSVYSTQITDASQKPINKLVKSPKAAPTKLSDSLLSIQYQPLHNILLEKGGFIEDSWLEIRLNEKKITLLKSKNQTYTMPLGNLKQDATLTIIPILWRQFSQNSKSPGQNITGERITIPIKNIVDTYGTTIIIKHNPIRNKQVLIEKAPA